MSDLNSPNTPDDIMDNNFWLKNYKDVALSDAVTNNNVNLVRSLLEKGANPNFDSRCYSVLLRAIRVQSVEIVKLLLKHGANINPTEKYSSDVPLNWAVSIGNIKIVELLLKAGADPNVEGGCGDCSLILAVERANVEMVELLLKHKANPNIVNCHGRTPLLTAAQLCYFPQSERERVKLDDIKCRKILLKNGADINARNEFGGTVRMNIHPNNRDVFASDAK